MVVMGCGLCNSIMLPPLIGGGIKRCFRLTSVAYIGPKWRAESLGRPKLAQR